MRYLKYIAAGVIALFGIVLLVITVGKKKLPVPDLKTAFRAIDAEADAKKAVAKLGREKALAKVREDYKETLEKLEGDEAKEAMKLVNDVPKLAKLLAGKQV